MRGVWSAVIFGVVSLAWLGAVSSEPLLREQETVAATTPHTITMKSISFDPKRLEVRVGDAVVWRNDAVSTHSATSDDEGKTFDTGEIDSETTSKPVVFARAGEFGYHCKVHGRSMRGTIVVKAAE